MILALNWVPFPWLCRQMIIPTVTAHANKKEESLACPSSSLESLDRRRQVTESSETRSVVTDVHTSVKSGFMLALQGAGKISQHSTHGQGPEHVSKDLVLSPCAQCYISTVTITQTTGKLILKSFSFKMIAPKILIVYICSIGDHGNLRHCLLLSLINTELWKQRHINILLFTILYLWDSEAENHCSTLTKRWTERWTDGRLTEWNKGKELYPELTAKPWQKYEPKDTGFTYTHATHRTALQYHEFVLKPTIGCKLSVFWGKGVGHIMCSSCQLKNRALVSAFPVS